MHRDASSCNTYNYGDALYWDARYVEEAGVSFDWYQHYSSLRPFVRKYIPTSSRVLMVGCGNARNFSPLPATLFFINIIFVLSLIYLFIYLYLLLGEEEKGKDEGMESDECGCLGLEVQI